MAQVGALIVAALVAPGRAAADCEADGQVVLESLDPNRIDLVGAKAMAKLWMDDRSSGTVAFRSEVFLEELAGFSPAPSKSLSARLCRDLGEKDITVLRRTLDSPELKAFTAAIGRSIEKGMTRDDFERVAQNAELDALLSVVLPAQPTIARAQLALMNLLWPRWSSFNGDELRGRELNGPGGLVVKAAAVGLSAEQRRSVAKTLGSPAWRRALVWMTSRRAEVLANLLDHLDTKIDERLPRGEKALLGCPKVLAQEDPANELYWGLYMQHCGELFVYPGMFSVLDSLIAVEPLDRWFVLATGLKLGLCEPTGARDPFCTHEIYPDVENSKRLARPLIAKHLREMHGEKFGAALDAAFWSRNELLFPTPKFPAAIDSKDGGSK